MKDFYQQLTLMGRVAGVSVAATTPGFEIKLLNDETIAVRVSATTSYEVLRNVGDTWRDRMETPDEGALSEAGLSDLDPKDPLGNARRDVVKYLQNDRLVVVAGILSLNGEKSTLDARRVVLMHNKPDRYGWEDAHWWLQQSNTLFEQWLDVLFSERREITKNDIAANYRTNLDLLGGRTDDVAQECATLSRFLYGLSSSYLLTGNERALSAAKACAEYLTEAFSVVSHDRQYCFWKFGRVYTRQSTREVVPSQNADDRNSYALYEQIYALSGLAQYYRVTQDSEILKYIRMTIAAFGRFYLDKARTGDTCFTGKGGYFSHIDTVTMRPDSPALVFDAGGNHYDNREKKNWNSVGDHIPAYLVNLLLAIDPLPDSQEDQDWEQLRTHCRQILDECVDNILGHFFDPESPFVHERFDAEWKPDRDWGWQKNRGIVGHNLKISWNLTRCGHYYTYLAHELKQSSAVVAKQYGARAEKCYTAATNLGKKMATVGVDLMRGGIWDAMERRPNEDGVHEFVWGNTKDFWQQEQAILAYYVMQGIEGLGEQDARRFLELARACTAFWNLFFIDQDNRKVYFRTEEGGAPVVQGQYGIQAGHAVAGYHAFELNYLAHIYIRTYVKQDESGHDNFALTFRPRSNGCIKSINVLPDFMPSGGVKIVSIRVNGLNMCEFNSDSFQLDISTFGEEPVIEVEFCPQRGGKKRSQEILQERTACAPLQFTYKTKR
jgi:mannose/cellobiose epimerase-like protein (N-acyl-D-glucosamine 2-epimerase family)